MTTENPFAKKQSERNLVAVNFNEAELAAFHELENFYGLKRSGLIKKLLADAYAAKVAEDDFFED